MDKAQLITVGLSKPYLDKCRSAAWEGNVASSVTYLVEGGVLLHKWTPKSGMESEMVDQVVVPKEFRLQVLNLVHDHGVSSHLGIRKTYRVLRYFFWPGLKTNVEKYCRSCHTCQITGKPNKVTSDPGNR